MTSKILVFVFAALALICGGVAYWQWSDAEDLRQQLLITSGTLNTVQTDLDTTRRNLADEQTKLRLASTPEPTPEPPPAMDEPQTVAPQDAPPAEDRPPRGGPTSEMRKMFQERMRSRIQQQYQTLFTKLGLKPEDQQKFIDLLMKRQQASGRRGFWDDASFGVATNPKMAAMDQEIKTLVGDANFQQVTEYQQNLPNQRQISELRDQLSGTQVPLQDMQVQQLQDIMKLARQQVAGTTSIDQMTPDQRVASLQSYQALVLQRAQGVLQPAQLDALKTTQQMQLQMAQAMAAGGGQGRRGQ
jgi:hypothetical protein